MTAPDLGFLGLFRVSREDGSKIKIYFRIFTVFKLVLAQQRNVQFPLWEAPFTYVEFDDPEADASPVESEGGSCKYFTRKISHKIFSLVDMASDHPPTHSDHRDLRVLLHLEALESRR